MKNLKKHFKFGFYLFFLTIISCLPLTPENSNRTVGLHWSLGQFVNEWKEPLGKYYTQYDGTIKAMFFTSSRQEEANIREITFSEAEGLVFRTPSATGMGPISSLAVDIVIKLPTNEEIAFPGFYGGPSNSYVRIAYSEELRDALLLENVIIRISMSNAFYRYQFTFPEKFKQAYGILMEKQYPK